MPPSGAKRKAKAPVVAAVAKQPKSNNGNGGGRSTKLAEAAQKEIDAKADGHAATPSIAGWLGKRNVSVVNPNPKQVVVIEDGVDAVLVEWQYEGGGDAVKQQQVVGGAVRYDILPTRFFVDEHAQDCQAI